MRVQYALPVTLTSRPGTERPSGGARAGPAEKSGYCKPFSHQSAINLGGLHMEAAAGKITITVILAILANFQQGLEALQKEDYATAVTQLSTVYEQDVPANRLRGQALYFRAQARWGQATDEAKAAALADLKVLLTQGLDPALEKEASALFTSYGGKPEDLLPEDTPKDVYDAFIKALVTKDNATALALTSGQWRQTVENIAARSPEALGENLQQQFHYQSTEIDILNKQAILRFQVGDNEHNDMEFLCTLMDGRWTLNLNRPGPKAIVLHESRRNGQPPQSSNVGNLKQIGLALLMYSGDNGGNFPPNLKALKDQDILDDGPVYLWTDPKQPGRSEPFVYVPGYKDDNEQATTMILAYAPQVTDGWREALFIDGHVEALTEERFQAMAREQKIKTIPLPDPKKVTAELRAQVDALVQQLGDRDGDVRAKARTAIEALGIDAHGALTPYLDDPDPEIRLTVREIMGR